MKTDEEKANLFAETLGETFKDPGADSEFDHIIYDFVKDFVAKYDYSDQNCVMVTTQEIVNVILLTRLNIIKIFSHRSWHISKKTLLNIYRTLIGSIFDYSFFNIASVANSNLNLIQTVQNRAILCVYKLLWDSPTIYLFRISRV